MERVIRIDRAVLVAAAAREFNDELTVIMSSLKCVLDELEDGHPALPLLAEMQDAAQRCNFKAYRLLQFGMRRGVVPPAAPLEKLLVS